MPFRSQPGEVKTRGCAWQTQGHWRMVNQQLLSGIGQDVDSLLNSLDYHCDNVISRTNYEGILWRCLVLRVNVSMGPW